MSDCPMLISNKLHSFRNFKQQIYDKRTGKAIDNRYLFLMFALEFFISVAFCRRNIWTATNYVVFLIKYYTQFP